MRFFLCCSLLLSPSFVGFSQTPHSATLHDFISAFNSRDIERLSACVSDSVRWYNIADDSFHLEIDGKAALVQWLKSYFQQCPSCRSEFISVQDFGRYAAVHERASWSGKNGRRSQQSLAVYEFSDNKIRRVWYYPAE